MIGKRWALEVAEKLAEWGSPEDIDDRAKLIEEMCPFEPDVVYMPVPRCDQCKHWERIDESCGDCNLPEDINSKVWATMYDGIHTSPDFGCVEFEERS